MTIALGPIAQEVASEKQTKSLNKLRMQSNTKLGEKEVLALENREIQAKRKQMCNKEMPRERRNQTKPKTNYNGLTIKVS